MEGPEGRIELTKLIRDWDPRMFSIDIRLTLFISSWRKKSQPTPVRALKPIESPRTRGVYRVHKSFLNWSDLRVAEMDWIGSLG